MFIIFKFLFIDINQRTHTKLLIRQTITLTLECRFYLKTNTFIFINTLLERQCIRF